MMDLAPGAHQLKVSALHPSGFFTAWTTNSFTNTLAYQSTADSYDSAGNITNRVWKNPGGTVERTQTLSWDARGRLHAVTDRDANNSGYNWSAVYDPLNRRLQTTTVLVTNGVASTAPPQTISSYFDPQVEFLELGVSYGDQTVWKLYGPDMNGRYGGLNGTGGLDGVSPYLDLFYPTISDFRGNILAEITNGMPSWIAARPTGYGAVPGYRPAAFANGADMAQSSAWRGREVDVTGYYNIGLRPYDPVSGRWLTYDSVWNARDPNYYSFTGGDPINGFDADGRGGVLAPPPPWQSQPGQSMSMFQALFPVVATGGGARPITGSIQNDITTVQQPFYSVAQPALQTEYSFTLGVLTGPIGGGTEGAITWGSVGGAALRGAFVNAGASSTVADVSGEPVAPAFIGGLATGAITGAGGEVASVFSPVAGMSLNAAGGFTGNFAGSSLEQVTGTGNVNWGASVWSGTFGALMNTAEGNVMGNVESALPKDVAESLTYQVPSEYMVGVGDTSLESWLTPPESSNNENQQPSPAYTQGPLGGKH